MSDLDPDRRPGELAFVVTGDAAGAEATVRAEEGLTHHDHLPVPADRSDEAIGVLCALRY